MSGSPVRQVRFRARLLAALLAAATVAASAEAAGGSAPAQDMVISEVMFNPDGDENAREFVELLNRGSAPVSLEEWLVGDGSAWDALVPVEDSRRTVPAGGYALILDPDYFNDPDPYPGIPAETVMFVVADQAIGSRGLSNSTAEPVSLVSAAGDTVSVVVYDLTCPSGHSWERIRPGGGDDDANFTPSHETGGTPGHANSATPPGANPALDGFSIRWTPADPGPGDQMIFHVSYLNAGLETLTAVRVAFSLLPDNAFGEAVLTEPVAPGERSPERTLTLDAIPGGAPAVRVVIVEPSDAASAGDDTITVSLVVPVEPGTLLLSEIMAAPSDGPEWVEVWNAAAWPVDLFGWGLRDDNAASPALIGIHRLLGPGGYAVIAAAAPSGPTEGSVVLTGFPTLNNDGDLVEFTTPAGTVSDSVRYGAAPAGVSLERTILRADAGLWDASTAPNGSTPGGPNSLTWVPEDRPDSPQLAAVPSPFADRTVISYDLPFPLARVTLSVYDRRGRKVAALREGEESGAHWEGTWEGRDDGSRLPPGPYIVSLEAMDRGTGRVVTARTVVVLAVRL